MAEPISNASHSGTTKPKKTRVTAARRILLSIFLLAFLVISFQFFVASLLLVKPENTISQWEKGKANINLVEAEQILTRLVRAETSAMGLLKTYDPVKINELRSRLFVLQAKRESPQENYRQAREYASRVTELAPSHYLGWALLAQAQLSDPGYIWKDQNALTKALTTGPFERKNQTRLFRLLIEHWELLSRENKQLTWAMHNSALSDRHTAYMVTRTMRKYKKTAIFSELLSSSTNSERLAKELGTK